MDFLTLINRNKDKAFVQLLQSEFSGSIARTQEVIKHFKNSRPSGGYPPAVQDLFYAFTVTTLDYNFDLARIICEVIFDLGQESINQPDL